MPVAFFTDKDLDACLGEGEYLYLIMDRRSEKLLINLPGVR